MVIPLSAHALSPWPRESERPIPEPSPKPLSELLPPGRIVEISGAQGCSCTTMAVSILNLAQRDGELVAWIQRENGGLYPPDLATAGIDLDSLTCIHIPTEAPAPAPLRAAELLLRSGAFGWVVLDLRNGSVPRDGSRWQGRLAGILREHEARLVLLTRNGAEAPSLGPMVGLRVEPRRFVDASGLYAVRPGILKSKLGPLPPPLPTVHRGPSGLP